MFGFSKAFRMVIFANADLQDNLSNLCLLVELRKLRKYPGICHIYFVLSPKENLSCQESFAYQIKEIEQFYNLYIHKGLISGQLLSANGQTFTYQDAGNLFVHFLNGSHPKTFNDDLAGIKFNKVFVASRCSDLGLSYIDAHLISPYLKPNIYFYDDKFHEEHYVLGDDEKFHVSAELAPKLLTNKFIHESFYLHEPKMNKRLKIFMLEVLGNLPSFKEKSINDCIMKNKKEYLTKWKLFDFECSEKINSLSASYTMNFLEDQSLKETVAQCLALYSQFCTKFPYKNLREVNKNKCELSWPNSIQPTKLSETERDASADAIYTYVTSLSGNVNIFFANQLQMFSKIVQNII